MAGAEDPEVTRQTLLCVKLIKIVSVLWLPFIFLILSGLYTVAGLETWSPAIQSTLNISLVISFILSIIVFLVSKSTTDHSRGLSSLIIISSYIRLLWHK